MDIRFLPHMSLYASVYVKLSIFNQLILLKRSNLMTLCIELNNTVVKCAKLYDKKTEFRQSSSQTQTAQKSSSS